MYDQTDEPYEIGIEVENENLVSQTSSGDVDIADVDGSSWTELTVFNVDPSTNTFDLAWDNPQSSGVRRNLEMNTPMDGGYTSTIIAVDSYLGERGSYVDTLQISTSTASDGPGLACLDGQQAPAQDADNDSLPAVLEQCGVPVADANDAQNLTLTASATDTDGDRLTDSRELTLTGALDGEPVSEQADFLAGLRAGDNESWEPVIEAGGFDLLANPTLTDTDDDQLNDSEELRGWTVSVINNSADEPIRWDYTNETQESVTFTSNPTDAKTDDDQLDDAEEREAHTNPRDEQSYTRIETQQQRIRDLTTGQITSNLSYMDQMGVDASLAAGTDYPNIELTDATADFDFVRTAEDGLDQFTFLALDGQPRTDTWFSNQAELKAGTDPWHNDTDNDGLTDGQEARWLTVLPASAEDPRSLEVTPAAPWSSPRSGCDGASPGLPGCQTVGDLGTDPTTADSDGDDYWDGWIGVYGVSRESASRHILYRHNLQTGDGIERDETLQQQIGVHDASAAPTDVSSDYGTASDIRSNIHVGELHLNSDPTDEDSEPSLTEDEITVEADFYLRNTFVFNSENWEQQIEENYRLYGIPLEIQRDDTVTSEDIVIDGILGTYTTVTRLNDEPLDLHMVAFPASPFPEPGANFDAIQETHLEADNACSRRGVQTLLATVNTAGVDMNDHVIVEEPISSEASGVQQQDVDRSPYASGTQLIGAFTEMHEIAHSLRIGEADDDTDPLPCGEVYSGSVEDNTLESVDPGEIDPDTEWSIMRSGYGSQALRGDGGVAHFAFSLEELFTIGRPNE